MTGRTTDAEFWKALYSSSGSNYAGYYGDSGDWGTGYNELDFNSPKVKRRHEYAPILLIYSTVYNCKYCGVKKEECHTDYCYEDDLDVGDWG